MTEQTSNQSSGTTWFVGASFGHTDDQSARFLEEGIWEISSPSQKEQALVRSMRPGERIAIKAAYVSKHGLPFDNRQQTVSVMGIKAIGVGGHPEGHPNMTEQQCWDVLESKVRAIESRGMAPLVVTQFGFDPDAFLTWLKQLRMRGLDVPVRIGVPGPASIKALLRLSARSGVGASASVRKKYGISLTNLIGSAGPDKLVDAFAKGLSGEHGRVRLHFYPFGGMVKTVEWIAAYNRKHGL